MDRETSGQLLHQVGMDLLQDEANGKSRIEIEAVGLLGVMGNLYATEMKIVCDRVSTNYKTLTISYIKDDVTIDFFTVTAEDIADPKEWHNKLLKKCGKPIPKD